MKVNILKKGMKLVEKGLSPKTVAKLTEGQINTLYNRLMNEQITPVQTTAYKVGPKGGSLPPSQKGYMLKQNPTDKTVMATAAEEEMKEELDDEDALGAVAFQTATGQEMPHDASDEAPDGMDDDSDNDRKMVGMTEAKGKKKNPWAICTAQLADEFGTSERSEWSKKQMNKYERCVKDVKKTLEEGKNPVSLFLEQKIIDLVEKHMPAKITKADLLNYLKEASAPAVAPSKPKTKPDIKPSTRPGHPGKKPFEGPNPAPKAKKKETKEASAPAIAPSKPTTKPDIKPSTRPGHPGKKPFEGPNPAPKAVSPEQAKEKIMDVIFGQILK
jgi:hypothetical protein